MKLLFKLFFIIHFLFVITYLFSNNYNISQGQKITYPYINPVFEQNWGMFSTPPISTRKVFFQYMIVNKKDTITSGWYDINASLYEFNNKHYFSIAQRLIKYESSCINSILRDAETCKNQNIETCITKSTGFKSLKKYAGIVLNKTSLNKKLTGKVYFKMKIFEDFFPDYENRARNFYDEKNHYFKDLTTEYDNLFE